MSSSGNISKKTETILPPTYAYYLVFRIFKDTLIHKIHFTVTRDRELWMPTGTMTYTHFEPRLSRFLWQGWPDPDEPKWEHHHHSVELYADYLFLCPKCGGYHPYLQEGAAHDFVRKLAEGSETFGKPGRWGMKLTDAAATRLYRFASSRLTVRSFQMKECNQKKECLEIHHREISKHNRSIRRSREIEVEVHQPPPLDIAAPIRSKSGYFLYLIRGGGFYKIGITTDVLKRIAHLQTSCPLALSLVKSWPIEEPRLVEKHLHKIFSEYRAQGEWFSLPVDEVEGLCVLTESELLRYRVGEVIVPFPSSSLVSHT